MPCLINLHSIFPSEAYYKYLLITGMAPSEESEDGYDYESVGLGKGTNKVPRKGAAAIKVRKDRAGGARGKATKNKI